MDRSRMSDCRLANSARSALSNFRLEVNRFRHQPGREIGKDAAE